MIVPMFQLSTLSPYFYLSPALTRQDLARSPFAINGMKLLDIKDHLKARGYRWLDGSDGGPKSWWIELPEAQHDEELHFLRTEIYRWEVDPPVQHLAAFARYRSR